MRAEAVGLQREVDRLQGALQAAQLAMQPLKTELGRAEVAAQQRRTLIDALERQVPSRRGSWPRGWPRPAPSSEPSLVPSIIPSIIPSHRPVR